MKRLLQTSALFSAVMLLSGCWGMNIRPERPNYGGNQTETDDHVINANYAGAFWCGQYNDYDVFNMYVCEKNVKVVDGVFGGIGTAMWLDMNVDRNADRVLESTVYNAGRNESARNSFIKGSLDKDGYIHGSYIYYRTSSRTAEYKLITGGSVSVNISGGKYKISGTVTAVSATEDTGIEEYRVEYYGNFDYTDIVEPDPTPNPGTGKDFSVSGLNHGRLEYNGKCLNVTNTNYADWIAFLADKNMNLDDRGHSTGEEVDIEFITAASASDLTPGRYEIKASGVNNDSAVPGGLFNGYIENDNYYGTWFFHQNGNGGTFGATEGYANVSKSGSNYRIEFSFIDGIENAKFSGVFYGPLEYRNVSQSAATKGLFQSSRRLVAVPARATMIKTMAAEGRPSAALVKAE